MMVEVTGPWRLENGLVVLRKFTAFEKSTANKAKIKSTDNSHKRTLQAQGDTNNWNWLNREETLLY